MKIITPLIHGYLDFLTVAIFLLAPTLLNFSEIPTLLSYGLAAAHLTVTLITGFPTVNFKLISFTVQGWIERIVGPVLIIAPFVFGFKEEALARNFFITMGIIIIVAGLLTNYQDDNRSFDN